MQIYKNSWIEGFEIFGDFALYGYLIIELEVSSI